MHASHVEIHRLNIGSEATENRGYCPGNQSSLRWIPMLVVVILHGFSIIAGKIDLVDLLDGFLFRLANNTCMRRERDYLVDHSAAVGIYLL